MSEVVFSGWHSDVSGKTTVALDGKPFFPELWVGHCYIRWFRFGWGQETLQSRILAEMILNKVMALNDRGLALTPLMVETFSELHVERWPWPGGWYLSSKVVEAFLQACEQWCTEQEEGVDLAALERELREGCNTPEKGVADE